MNRFIPLLICSCTVLLLSGCWNSRQLTDLALVMGVGIDMTDDGDYRVSFQVANPTGTNARQFSMPNESGPVSVYAADGSTVFEALRKASKVVPRRLFFSHTSALIVSEDVARQGLLDVLDLIDRDPEFRTSIYLLIARGSSAEEIISKLSPLEKIPAKKISGSLKNSQSLIGTNVSSTVDQFISALIRKGQEPVVSGIRLQPDTTIPGKEARMTPLRIDGVGLFKHDKLVSWVQGKKARGIVWGLGEMVSTIIDLKCKDEKSAIAKEVIRSSTHLSVDMKGEVPLLKVKVEEEGNLAEISCPTAIEDPQVIQALEEQTEMEIQKEIEDAIRFAQGNRIDIFGFGLSLHRRNPDAWNKVRDDWNERFAEAKVSVQVESYIRRAGLRTKSILEPK